MMNTISNEYWIRYHQNKAPELKNELIENYVYLVKLVAGRLGMYLNHYVELEDLIGYGVMGLIDAIDKYDYTKNVKFETYASLRIRGAIIDEIRKLDWVPRSLRKKQKDLNKIHSELECELGRVPTDDEVANRLEMDKDAYLQLLQESNVNALVFIEDYKLQVESIKEDTSNSPDDQIERKEMIAYLAEAIKTLPEREQMVISLYYFDEMTLKEISAILEVSESRVSQLHTKGVSRLRQKLEKYRIMLPL